MVVSPPFFSLSLSVCFSRGLRQCFTQWLCAHLEMFPFFSRFGCDDGQHNVYIVLHTVLVFADQVPIGEYTCIHVHVDISFIFDNS